MEHLRSLGSNREVSMKDGGKAEVYAKDKRQETSHLQSSHRKGAAGARGPDARSPRPQTSQGSLTLHTLTRLPPGTSVPAPQPNRGSCQGWGSTAQASFPHKCHQPNVIKTNPGERRGMLAPQCPWIPGAGNQAESEPSPWGGVGGGAWASIPRQGCTGLPFQPPWG